MNSLDLKDRTKMFALRVLKLTAALPEKQEARVIRIIEPVAALVRVLSLSLK